MKKNIISFFFFIFINTISLYAGGINSAGFVGSTSSIQFADSISYGTENQDSYLASVAGIFGCPKPGEGQTMILHELDAKTGNITCYLYGETSTDPIQIFKQTGAAQQKFLEESSALKNILDSGGYKNLVVSQRFGIYEFNSVNQGYTERYVQQFNLSELSAINEKIKSFLESSIQDSENGDKSAFSNANIALDSYTNSNRVLSNILTGLITLNPDFFEPNSLVNENGTVALKDYALFGDSNTSNASASGDDSTLKDLMRKVTGNKDNVSNVGVKVLTVVNFVDKKFWGFYAYLIYNLKEAYIHIIGTMMLFGGVFALGKFGYRRVKDKVNKDKGEQGDGKLASKGMDIFLVIAMFLVPITTNNAKIPDQFVYSKSNKTLSTSASSSQSEELFTHSTLSSSMIRYFSNLGSSWANVVNDYALFSYLRYLESKQKAITASGISQNEEDIKSLYTSTFFLKKEYDFYIEVCRSSFSSVLSSTTRFNSISDESKESFLNNTVNLKGTSIGDKLGYTKINPLLCVKLEESIFTKTKKILADYSRVQLELNVSKAILDNYNTKTVKDFNTYIDFMQFISNSFGWISTAVVPPSYSLLFNGSSSVFAYDIAQKNIANNDGNNLSQTWAGNSDEKRKIEEDGVVGGLVNSAFSKVQKQFIWFVMPGFEPIFKHIYQYFSNIAYLDPTYYQSNDSKLVTYIEKVIDWLSTFTWIFGKVFGSLIKGFMFLAKSVITPALYFILLMAAIYVAIQIYVTMVTTITMIIIGGAITIKICLYFMELLLYYFLSDAILFISIVTQKNDYFIKFLTKGVTITLLTPLLIVLSVYVYIAFHTLATELYSMLINSIYEIATIQNETIVENSSSDAVQAAFQSVAIASTQYFGEVVIMLFSVVIGTAVIFKFKDWVFKMMGVEDDGFSSGVSSEISQKLTGGLNPVK